MCMWHDHTPPSEHTRVCVFLPCVAEIIFHHQNTKVMSLACMCSFPALQWSCASIIKQLSDSVCAFPGVTVICASVRTWRYQTCVCVPFPVAQRSCASVIEQLSDSVCAFPGVTVICASVRTWHYQTCVCVCVPFPVLQWSSASIIK